MITKDNLPDLLITLAFDTHDSTYRKTIGTATLEINLTKGEIVYPAGLTVNQNATCNLSANENFVVLECVHRLLEKGYKPEHIELEPKWKLGHGASGGRADILVKDNDGKPLLIIECKTAAANSNAPGTKPSTTATSFSATPSRSAKPSFSASTPPIFDDGALTYTSHIIAHRDNEKYLDDNPPSRLQDRHRRQGTLCRLARHLQARLHHQGHFRAQHPALPHRQGQILACRPQRHLRHRPAEEIPRVRHHPAPAQRLRP